MNKNDEDRKHDIFESFGKKTPNAIIHIYEHSLIALYQIAIEFTYTVYLIFLRPRLFVQIVFDEKHNCEKILSPVMFLSGSVLISYQALLDLIIEFTKDEEVTNSIKAYSSNYIDTSLGLVVFFLFSLSFTFIVLSGFLGALFENRLQKSRKSIAHNLAYMFSYCFLIVGFYNYLSFANLALSGGTSYYNGAAYSSNVAGIIKFVMSAVFLSFIVSFFLSTYRFFSTRKEAVLVLFFFPIILFTSILLTSKQILNYGHKKLIYFNNSHLLETEEYREGMPIRVMLNFNNKSSENIFMHNKASFKLKFMHQGSTCYLFAKIYDWEDDNEHILKTKANEEKWIILEINTEKVDDVINDSCEVSTLLNLKSIKITGLNHGVIETDFPFEDSWGESIFSGLDMGSRY